MKDNGPQSPPKDKPTGQAVTSHQFKKLKSFTGCWNAGRWSLSFICLLSAGYCLLFLGGCVALRKDVDRVERDVDESRWLITTKDRNWQKKYASLSEEMVGLRAKSAENEGAISVLLVRIEKSNEKAENFRNQAGQELVLLQKGFSSQKEDLASRIEDLSLRLKKIQKDVEKNSKRISEISLSLNETKDLTRTLREKYHDKLTAILLSLNETKDLARTLNEKYESKLTVILDEIKKENERLIKEIEGIKKRSTPQFHIVKEGETISAIASLYRVAPEEVLKVNHISNPDKIFVGQKLIIPGKGEDG